MKTIKYITIAALVLTAMWYCTRTTYEYTYYKLGTCEDTYLTVILYQSISDRGLIFANGKVDYPPTENVLWYPHFSGMDALVDCIATCNNHIITISTYESVLEGKSDNMVTRMLDTEQYNKLKRSKGAVDLRIF